MRGRWRSRRAVEEGDLNITAFMNLMVILVPFLLITAAFSRITILELSLPEAEAPAASAPVSKRPVQLEVIIRSDALEVADRTGGLLRRFEQGAQGLDLEGLSAFLRELKQRFPNKRDISLLAEPQVSYQTLVSVMDRVRQTEIVKDGKRVRAELFPEIGIGDAPRVGTEKGK